MNTKSDVIEKLVYDKCLIFGETIGFTRQSNNTVSMYDDEELEIQYLENLRKLKKKRKI